jgi:hypothetical protein
LVLVVSISTTVRGASEAVAACGEGRPHLLVAGGGGYSPKLSCWLGLSATFLVIRLLVGIRMVLSCRS